MKFILSVCMALLLTIGDVWGQSTTCVAPTAEFNSYDPQNTYSARINVYAIAASDFLPQWRKLGEAWRTGDLFYLKQYDNPGSYIQTNLEPGNNYEIRFQRWCTNGLKSDFSTPLSFSTPVACLAPNNLSVNGNVLSWYPNSGLSYVVEWRKQGQTVWEASPVLNEFSVYDFPRRYFFTGQTTGLYEWRVKAICADGNSSAYIQGQTFNYSLCERPNEVPNGPFIDVNATSAQLSIVMTCLEEHYEIRWRKSGEVYWNLDCASDSLIVQDNNYLTRFVYYNINTLSAETDYEYQIGYLRQGKPTLYTSISSFTTLSTTPYNLSVSCLGATNATLYWQSGRFYTATGIFEIQHRIKGSSQWTTTTTDPLTSPQYNLTGLSLNTAYEWRVRRAGVSQSVYSEISSFTTECPKLNLVSYTSQFIGLDCSQTRLYWQFGCTNTGTRFVVRYRPQGATIWAATVDAGEESYYDIPGLILNQTYEAQVLAYCPASASPISSGIVSIRANCICRSLGNCMAQNITANTATLKWQPLPYESFYTNGPTEFRWRRTGSSTWNTIIVSAPYLEYNLRGLTDQTTYEWQARAVCDAANAFTPIQVFRTVCNVPFSTRTKCITSSSALLTWKNAGGRTTYSIDWRPVGSTTWTTVSSLTSSSYELIGLTANKPYEWRIRTECSTVANSPNGPTVTFYTNVCSDQLHTVKTGLWSDPATWSCGRVPLANDLVFVSHTVTVAPNSINKTRQIHFQPGGKIVYGNRGRVQMQF